MFKVLFLTWQMIFLRYSLINFHIRLLGKIKLHFMKLRFVNFLRVFIVGFLFNFILSNNVIAQIHDYLTNDSIRAQKDIVDVFFGSKRDSIFQKRDPEKNKLFFSLMPLSGSSGGEGGIGISTVNVSFFMGDPKTTRLSNITFYPTTNFNSYVQFRALPNLWLNNNSWNIPGKVEVAYNMQDNYGLGGNTSPDSLFVIQYQLTRLYLTFNKLISRNLYVGLGWNFDDFYNVNDLSDSTYYTPFEQYEYGNSESSLSSGITFNVLFDSRKNSINPLKGLYSSFLLRWNNPWMGSNYNWQSAYFDTRKYISFSNNRHRTLALWGLYWGTWGDVPYLNLPGSGLDFSNWTARGYYKARYRGKQMLYAEAEYRFDLNKNGLWGAVVFANAQSFIETDTKRFEYILPAVGTGLRLKFNKYSDSNLTFDVAVGKDSYNWYFGLNEVF